MPDEMSGGQRQRVAIARAIVRNPGVFLMDEPLANLDAKLRVHMRTELQRLHKELDTTIIYVTHDQAEAMTMSDRIAVIDSGQLQQIAPPLTCYNEPSNLFVAGFIGSPSMNFLDGEITQAGFESTNISVDFDPAEVGVDVGTQVTMGIRPEDVYLTEEKHLVSNPSHHFDAITDVLEPMGDEIFVYLKLEEDTEAHLDDVTIATNDQLLMSVAPDTEVEEENNVTVVLDRSRVHLFDTETGKAISHGLDAMAAPNGTPDAVRSGN
jgi:multiple sugar transport system ATP-binding protein